MRRRRSNIRPSDRHRLNSVLPKGRVFHLGISITSTDLWIATEQLDTSYCQEYRAKHSDHFTFIAVPVRVPSMYRLFKQRENCEHRAHRKTNNLSFLNTIRANESLSLRHLFPAFFVAETRNADGGAESNF